MPIYWFKFELTISIWEIKRKINSLKIRFMKNTLELFKLLFRDGLTNTGR